MVVLDASAAIDAVRNGTQSPVFTYLMKSGEETVAPEFFCLEAAQAAWKYVRAGQLEKSDAQAMLGDSIGLVEVFYADAELIREAFTEAIRTDHSLYDMLYFVLARRTASPLLTCDHQLAKICEQNNISCVSLEDFK